MRWSFRVALGMCAVVFISLTIWAAVGNAQTSNKAQRISQMGERLVDDVQGTNNGPTKVDTVSSEACTRAGTFALLLSVVLFLLVPYWRHHEKDVALREYRATRYNLVLYLEMLDDDPLWQEYCASHDAAELMSIAKLRDLWVETPNAETSAVKEPSKPAPVTIRKPRDVGGSKPVLPLPPTMVTVKLVEKLREPPQIVNFLSRLNEPKLLTRSREAERFFDLSISRWVNKRNDLVYRNVILHSCMHRELEVPYKEPVSEYFVPALQSEALLNCLTLHDLRELAQFELPPNYSPVQNGESEVDIVPGSLPRDPYMASVLAQVLLFFVIVYFGAFAREAVLSTTFPAQGTLFGALSKSPLTLLVFLFALWSPLIASLVVAVTSRKWPIVVLGVLIFCAVLSVQRVLMQKSYFRALDPRQLVVHRKQPVKNAPVSDSQSTDQDSQLSE